MLWRSAPEAKRTVAPRRSAAGWQAVVRTAARSRTERTPEGISLAGPDGRQEIAGMSRLLLRRAVTGAAVVFGVLTLMFFLLRLAPGAPARLLVGPAATESQVAAQRHALGLDRPAPAQY